MKNLIVGLLLMLALLLVACGGTEPAETEATQPAETPAETTETEATATPVSAETGEETTTEATPPPVEGETGQTEAGQTGTPLDTMEHVPDPNLIDKTWVWERRDPNGNQQPEISVSNPENYTLRYNADGTFSAKLDCNNVAGQYATNMIETATPSIFMVDGPSTMVFCGEQSLETQMRNIFGGAVQNYEISGNGTVLKLIFAAGGPLDYYRAVSDTDLPDAGEGASVGTVTAPDGVFLRTGPGTNYPYVGAAAFGDSGEIIGVSEDGQWWLASAPNLPGGQVWVSATFVSVTDPEGVPVVNAPSPEPTLTGIPWQWVSTTNPATGPQYVTDPTRYAILFNDDSTANIRADCNNVSATYVAVSSNINIELGPSTRVACPEDSQADTFLQQLNDAAIYFIDGGNLYIDLPADAGTMRFVPQGTPPPSPNPPAGEADSKTFFVTSFGPQGAEQAVLSGSQITASFSDTQISGNAGCNNYSGTLTPVEGFFTISGIVTTRKACGEPEGVMAQEQAYLTALQGVDGFLWQEQLVGGSTLITTGTLSYTLADGTVGVINMTTNP